jgi:hypothetical protein
VPPIMLTKDEFSSLKKIVERARPISEIPEDHAAKFVNYGQLELLRQRFRGIPVPKRIVLDGETTRNSILLSLRGG